MYTVTVSEGGPDVFLSIDQGVSIVVLDDQKIFAQISEHGMVIRGVIGGINYVPGEVSDG
jgi:hypothetical protein